MAASHGEVAGILSTGYWSDPSADNRRWSWSHVKLATSHLNRLRPSGSGGFIPPDYFCRFCRFPSTDNRRWSWSQVKLATSHITKRYPWSGGLVQPGNFWVFMVHIKGDCVKLWTRIRPNKKLLLPIRRTLVYHTTTEMFPSGDNRNSLISRKNLDFTLVVATLD